MIRRLYDLPTGYGGFLLWLLGGPRLVPAVGYMGGKRRLAAEMGEALALRPGVQPEEIVIADAGCPGWVWPEILTVERAGRVAEVLRSWKDEGPVELWDRLAALPPAVDPSERAAQVLWLQGRTASSTPLQWDGVRWVMATGARGGGRQSKSYAVTQKALVSRGTWRGGRSSGLQRTSSVADRIEAIARALSRHRVRFHHGDLFDVIPDDAGPGDLFYFDPDYVGCTSYGATVPRERLLAVAEGGTVLACWGGPYSPSKLQRVVAARAEELLQALEGVPLHALALSQDGFPRHTLFLPGASVPFPWRP